MRTQSLVTLLKIFFAASYAPDKFLSALSMMAESRDREIRNFALFIIPEVESSTFR